MSVGDVLARAVGVSKAFAGVTVLKNASVDLRAGEVHAFMGENGAGKSTLAKIIAGLHQPTDGSLEVGGKTVAIPGPRAAAALGIALIPQEPLTFPDLSAAENIFVGRLPQKGGRVDWKLLYSEAERLLKMLNAPIDPQTPARLLSVADRQMLELAGALSQDAKVLILDETTASLTPSEVARLAVILRQLKADGKAIAFIGHRMEEIFDFCDRLTILRDGEIVGERMTKDTTRDELVKLMVGREVDLLSSRPAATIGKPLLETKKLTRSRKFEDVSLTIRSGEVVGLAGLVGAGRTDIARSIFGLLSPDRGEILIDGQPTTIKSPVDAMKHGLALVPEDRHRHGAMLPVSLWENASLAALPELSKGGWLKNKAARGMADGWLSKLGVRMREADQPIAELSGGNQQKIVIAKWLETKPKVLILDEPTRGIDVRTKSEIHRLIGGLVEEGLGVMLISSDLPEILTMCDRILVVRKGQIVAEFTRESATSEAILAAAAGIEIGQSTASTSVAGSVA